MQLSQARHNRNGWAFFSPTCTEFAQLIEEKSVVTVKKRTARQPLHAEALPLRKANGDGHRHPAKAQEAVLVAATDFAYAAPSDQALHDQETVVGEAKSAGGLIARGKDLLSGEAGGVATAAAIVVGAALIEVELIPGLIIGAGAILLGKLFPEMSSYVRPMVKGAVRAGFSMSQKVREVVAEASEQVHDLVAEVKHEQEQQPGPAMRNHASGKVAAATGGLPVH
jgi:hypothetical protein